MVEEIEAPTSATALKNRKKGFKRGRESKKMKVAPGMGKKNKINKKMQKLFRKRAREYNSDDDGDDDGDENVPESTGEDLEMERNGECQNDDNELGSGSDKEGQASDDEDEVQTGITKFVEGCKAFRVAFHKIMKRHVDDETLGPVLSAHKKLVVAKLAEEDAERKVKGEAKKEKRLIEEKGHIKPANFLDSHEKFLTGVATKGVVKLFNAVNKAQNAQKGLNPSRFKDAKALTKRRKEAFFSELTRASGQSVEGTTKVSTSRGEEENGQPAWAPLRDTFMLTNSKLKDWDKMAVEQSDI
uniref:RRP15-like protein n=1 Tax=Opuntia streptacantha TaxID=393608 RepID=A0A7C8YD56_OPUST